MANDESVEKMAGSRQSVGTRFGIAFCPSFGLTRILGYGCANAIDELSIFWCKSHGCAIRGR
jgi:hypothetical protein